MQVQIGHESVPNEDDEKQVLLLCSSRGDGPRTLLSIRLPADAEMSVQTGDGHFVNYTMISGYGEGNTRCFRRFGVVHDYWVSTHRLGFVCLPPLLRPLFLNRVPEHIVSNVLSFLSAAEVTISGREGNMICEDLMVWNVQRMQSQF